MGTVKIEKGQKKYHIQKDDSLGKIAKRFYGDIDLWGKIYDKNRKIIGKDPYKIEPCKWIIIPKKKGGKVTLADKINALKSLKGSIEKTNSMLENLKKKGKLNEAQKKKFKKLEERKKYLLLKKLKKELDELQKDLKEEGMKKEKKEKEEKKQAKAKGSIINPKDKKRWNTKQNVKDLAKIITTEAEGENRIAKIAVGYVVLNRMKRNKKNTVRAVWSGFAHGKKAKKQILNLARKILSCEVKDNSRGATHFYSPQSMPKEGGIICIHYNH